MSNHWDRKARQLLLNPQGRAALKQFGIDVEIVGEGHDQSNQSTNGKAIVPILCPTYRSPEPRMTDALARMVQYTRSKDCCVVYSGPPIQAGIVHWARNALISEQIRSGKPWTHVLFIDDDIVVPEDALEKLLSHKKDIVAGLCVRRTDPPLPNIRYFDVQAEDAPQIWEWPENELIEVDGVGTGLMLISQHALEQVAQAYFDCLYERDFYGLSDEKTAEFRKARIEQFEKDHLCYWFRFLPSANRRIEMGEDMGFCFIAKRYCDLKVYVDTSVQPGHLGPYPYSIRDFLPYRDQCILRAKINGGYKMDVPPMKISILCPTRGRPDNVLRLLKSLQDTSTIIPETVFYVDDDDKFPGSLPFPDCKIVRGPRIVMSEMWNRCAEAAAGEILMVAGDDLVFRAKGWDDAIRRAFAAFDDRIALVHCDDGGPHKLNFGTHPFIHRVWYEATGYVTPPYFQADFCDVWLNEVANKLERRVPLPILIEHMHPVWHKAKWDETHNDRLNRLSKSDPKRTYELLSKERDADVEKLRVRLGHPYKVEHPHLDSTKPVGIFETTESQIGASVAAGS